MEERARAECTEAHCNTLTHAGPPKERDAVHVELSACTCTSRELRPSLERPGCLGVPCSARWWVVL
jgi:hypothetical protein